MKLFTVVVLSCPLSSFVLYARPTPAFSRLFKYLPKIGKGAEDSRAATPAKGLQRSPNIGADQLDPQGNLKYYPPPPKPNARRKSFSDLVEAQQGQPVLPPLPRRKSFSEFTEGREYEGTGSEWPKPSSLADPNLGASSSKSKSVIKSSRAIIRALNPRAYERLERVAKAKEVLDTPAQHILKPEEFQLTFMKTKTVSDKVSELEAVCKRLRDSNIERQIAEWDQWVKVFGEIMNLNSKDMQAPQLEAQMQVELFDFQIFEMRAAEINKRKFVPNLSLMQLQGKLASRLTKQPLTNIPTKQFSQHPVDILMLPAYRSIHKVIKNPQNVFKQQIDQLLQAPDAKTLQRTWNTLVVSSYLAKTETFTREKALVVGALCYAYELALHASNNPAEATMHEWQAEKILKLFGDLSEGSLLPSFPGPLSRRILFERMGSNPANLVKAGATG
ncbi:hypothetical protein O181_011003 [Austropuccinia psidii MF-1]|uniref:Uncharacterized protein n=1 Tax=Austropuccinia psidii MF-1 TaxID=1389203 RepID=A0A9Q3BU27_9BASI|nr:hypothetical protein [Austropuccinia psidii MF-1]